MSASIILAGTALLAGRRASCRDRIPACQSIECSPKSIAPRDEIVDFAARLIRIPTVNPPGEEYESLRRRDRRPAARARRGRAAAAGDRPRRAHAAASAHQRRRPAGRIADGPAIHLNGHFDVVPAGLGWTRDPFGGEIVDGTLVRPRLLRHESRHRRGGVCRRSDPARRHRARRADRNQRHGRRRERRLCRRRVAGGEPACCRASGPRR